MTKLHVTSLLGLLITMLAACGNESDLQACDIRERECQDDIYLAVQRARGSAWDPWLDRTPMRVITAEEYAAELTAQQQRAKEAAEKAEGFDYQNAALELLRLLDPNREPAAEVEAKVGNVAAYYSYATRSVTIIDHGNEGDIIGRTTVLAHELVHAAQDRELGLWGFLANSTRDASFALRSVIEGEAVLHANVVMLGIEGSASLDEIDWLGYYDRMLSGAKTRVFEDASPEFQLYGLLYPLGTRTLTERYLRGGNAAVREMWANVPASTVKLMADDVGDLPPFTCGGPSAPEDYRLISSNSLGAIGLYGVATRLYDDLEDAWSAAGDWRGDWFYVFGQEEATVVVWQVLIDGPARAEFARRARDFYGEGAVAEDGDYLIVTLQSAEDPVAYEDRGMCGAL